MADYCEHGNEPSGSFSGRLTDVTNRHDYKCSNVSL